MHQREQGATLSNQGRNRGESWDHQEECGISEGSRAKAEAASKVI